jgi:hypothetical protein
MECSVLGGYAVSVKFPTDLFWPQLVFSLYSLSIISDFVFPVSHNSDSGVPGAIRSCERHVTLSFTQSRFGAGG